MTETSETLRTLAGRLLREDVVHGAYNELMAHADAMEKLERLGVAARLYMEAEVADDAHRTACKNGCTADGGECEEYGVFWLATMKARAAFWKEARR